MRKTIIIIFLCIFAFVLVACGSGINADSDPMSSSILSSQDMSDPSDQSEDGLPDRSDMDSLSQDEVDSSTVTLPVDLSDYTETLYVDSDEDFVILNLTDFQLHDGKSTYASFAIIDELVEKVKPDLITVLGDTAEDNGEFTTTKNFSAIVEHIDSLNIPWAPVFGNHDNEAYREPNSVKDTTNEWIINKFLSAKNSLFNVGPDSAHGNGNYIVNIVDKSSNKLIKSLFFFDAGMNGVDNTHVSFYEDAVKYCEYLNKDVIPESIVFMHIPLPEYKTVWSSRNYEGIAGEQPSVGGGTTSFFAKIKELGSTTHVICGHDHINSFYANYQGVYLMYCLKSSDGDYYDADQLGGTSFIIGETTTFEYHFVNVANEVVAPTFYNISKLDDFKNSGKAFSFEYKAVENEKNSGSKIEFTLWKADWSKRVSVVIVVDIVNDVIEGDFGEIVDLGNGWRRLIINCSEVPINTLEGATGNESVGLIYYNTVSHAFLLKNIDFIDENSASSPRTPVSPISDGGEFDW